MKYISSPSTDAFFNMALEEYVFEHLPRTDEYFMLWQNKNAIVVGKYQNTLQEINPKFVEDNNISVVRRLSGGGAMYQDMGNLNFTFIVTQSASKNLDFEIFMNPVVHALKQVGVTAGLNSRNDIVIDGKKFSGNSQYNKQGRTMHHGTLLFNSNLSVVGSALQVKQSKIQSKGIQSVRSRVTNIIDYLAEKITLDAFKQVLLTHMFDSNTTLEEYTLTPKDLAGIAALRDEKYATWNWVYGKSPACNQQKEQRYPFGAVCAAMQVNNYVLENITFSGDFFGNGDITQLASALQATPLTREALLATLNTLDVNHYISGMDATTLANLLLY